MSFVVRQLGVCDYGRAWQQMRHYTAQRAHKDPDAIWFLQHPPVFTLGQAGREEHILRCGPIPVIHSDRGGQATFHAPGQLIAYLLIDLRRRGFGARTLAAKIQRAAADVLRDYGLAAKPNAKMPGVYVDGEKIAALGLRIRRGCCYHGLSLNVNLDLAPFANINPCGYADLKVTSMQKLGIKTEVDEVAARLAPHLVRHLSAP